MSQVLIPRREKPCSSWIFLLFPCFSVRIRPPGFVFAHLLKKAFVKTCASPRLSRNLWTLRPLGTVISRNSAVLPGHILGSGNYWTPRSQSEAEPQVPCCSTNIDKGGAKMFPILIAFEESRHTRVWAFVISLLAHNA